MSLSSGSFTPSNSTNDASLWALPTNVSPYYDQCNGQCIWWHEEPLDLYTYDKLWNEIYYSFIHTPHLLNVMLKENPNLPSMPLMCDQIFHTGNFWLLANSEKSNIKKNILKKYKFYDWYFFYHGLAALDWFRDYKYLKLPESRITKTFISLNHLLTKKRSYRLSLLSHLHSEQLIKYGYVSAPLLDKKIVQNELFDKNSWLSNKIKRHLYENLLPNAKPIILDAQKNYLDSSATIIDQKYSLGSLWHIVTETIFYEERLHLTEKIFKPIVVKRPFILIGAVGNLKYLRSYGFKTFDQWIDESYDEENDPDLRLLKIINEIKKLCALSNYELEKMHYEMQSVLEFNFNHFFNDFKIRVIDELVDNFKKALFLYNMDKSYRFRLPDHNINYDEIKKKLQS